MQSIVGQARRSTVSGKSYSNQKPWHPHYPLSKHLRYLVCHATARSTKTSYHVGWKLFKSFCYCFNLPPLPAYNHMLAYFAADLSCQALAPSTVRVYTAAVGAVHRAHVVEMCLQYLDKVTKGQEGLGTFGRQMEMPLPCWSVFKLLRAWFLCYCKSFKAVRCEGSNALWDGAH